MSGQTAQLVGKVNLVMSARRLKEKGYIEDDNYTLPTNLREEEELLKEMLFAFLKKKFIGCKIRVNANSFSLRLDGAVHRKANKMRDIYNNENEWKNFFQQHHSDIYNTMRNNRSYTFRGNSSVVERREVDGKVFLYVPFRTNRLFGYANTGLFDFCKFMEDQYSRDEQLASIYARAMELMEVEIARKEQERLERIARELEAYKRETYAKLLKPVATLQESQDPTERLFAQKFIEWARENGKVPEYAVAADVTNMIPIGTKVKIKAPADSEEEGWVVLPPFEGYTEPEHLELQGWGKVTAIDTTGERSRGGVAPVVVQEYLYLEFDIQYWAHLLPEGHAELLETTKRIREEAEAEIAPFLEEERRRQEEQERVRKEQELARKLEEKREREERERLERERLAEEEARLQEIRREAELRERQEREEMERLAAMSEQERTERQARQAQLAEQLRAQLQPTVVDASPEPIPVVIQAEVVRNPGYYMNSMAIPLERYVLIRENEQLRRFATIERLVQAAAEAGLIEEGTSSIAIYDYNNPDTVVMHHPVF